MPALTHDDIFAKVRDILVEALGVRSEEVTPDASVRDDLGAESIEFLDIQFRLERVFGIKIPKGDMMPEDLQNNPDFVQSGKLTDAGINELKSRLPHADFSKLAPGDDLETLSRLFTTEAVVRYVEQKLN
ncbi:MAG: acyl carrier protein [Planctomycetota bacterium]